MTTEQPIDLNVIDEKEIKKFKEKKKRAIWVLDVIKESNLDKNEEFMNEINPLIEELLKD